MSFSWDNLLAEWEKEAPLLHRILTSVAKPKRADTLTKEHIPSVCIAGSILMKSHNIHMSAVQHLIGLLLLHGGVIKQVYKSITIL